MPLRQSTLDFGRLKTTERVAKEEHVQCTDDSDTIVVGGSEVNLQLPTPSESATDVSSQSSQPLTSTSKPKSRSKRVSSALQRQGSPTAMLEGTDHEQQGNNRSVSGETLVQGVSDIDGMLKEKTPESYVDVQQSWEHDPSSVIVVREDSEDEKLREEKCAAKKAKMQQNAKKWEDRKQAAEKSATRRSGRATLMEKASELLDNIKGSVLGKRTRNMDESDAKTKSSEKSGCSTADGAKRQRLNEDKTLVNDSKPKPTVAPREKKWLVSGLFAGQPRMFDARLTENKNKRKSKVLEGTQAKDNSVLPLPMFAGERLLQYGRDFKLPFDVFSPLPAGQPKPDEWKKVNKNVFIGDAAAEWRTNKYVEHSTCLCTTSTGCGQDCMNRYMYYECDDRNCNVGESRCSNRSFADLGRRSKIGDKYSIGVEVIKTADRGYGVRSNRTFMPNQIIVEYTGEIVTQEECERRMRTIYKANECYYLMLFDQNMIIDATRGSIARFVNHSCEPNCRMEKWTVGGKPRMALFAGDRGIMTGEELTYDYNFDPYSQKNVQECRCGAKTCRGILGPKPKPEAKRNSPEEEVGKKKAGKLSGAKRKVIEVLEESTNGLNKKRKFSKTSAKQKRSPTKPSRGSQSPKRTVLVKKVTTRKINMPKSTAKLGRSDSKLKKILSNAKNKAGSVKNKRAVSASSATKALLSKKKTIARSSSLVTKAKSMTKSVRRTNTISVAG